MRQSFGLNRSSREVDSSLAPSSVTIGMIHGAVRAMAHLAVDYLSAQ